MHSGRGIPSHSTWITLLSDVFETQTMSDKDGGGAMIESCKDSEAGLVCRKTHRRLRGMEAKPVISHRNVLLVDMILLQLFLKLGIPMSAHSPLLCAISTCSRVGEARSCMKKFDPMRSACITVSYSSVFEMAIISHSAENIYQGVGESTPPGGTVAVTVI